MEKLVTAFKKLMVEDKPHFLLAAIRVGVSLLLFVSLFFTFFRVVGPGLNNPIGANEFVGAGWFITIWLLFIPAYMYLTLIANQKYLKILCIVQSVLATVYFLWGLIMFSATMSAAEEQFNIVVYMGFGLVLQVILGALLWFLTYGEDIAMKMVVKYMVKPIKPVEAVAVPAEKIE
jgi:hypothetical protein